MSIITFWGVEKGKTAATSSCLAFSTYMAVNYNVRSLLAHTQFRNPTLENAFKAQAAHELDNSEFGADGLERLHRSKILQPNLIRNYTVPVIQDRLDILPGTRRQKHHFEQLNDFHIQIWGITDKQYEVTVIDVESGDAPLSKSVMDAADVNVVMLNQNYHLLSEYLKEREWDKSKTLFVVGSYDPESRAKIANMERSFRMKNQIFAVPYHTEFKDAINTGEILNFFLRYRYQDKGSKHYSFFSEVHRFTESILKMAGVNTKLKAMER